MTNRVRRVGDGESKIVVFWARREATCDECGQVLAPGSLIRLLDRSAQCLDCADLDHLVFLPSGDAALTRRAARHSRLCAVVVRWSRSRKRYERQGILVEEDALQRAEEECLSDADRRAAQRARAAERRERLEEGYVQDFALAVRQRYPGCPDGVDLEIAQHACRKYSGRIGRSALARTLADEAVDLAARAHIRHRWTRYDDYLMRGWDRGKARSRWRPSRRSGYAVAGERRRSTSTNRDRSGRPTRWSRKGERAPGLSGHRG